MAQQKKRKVQIVWSLSNHRQLEFLRACGLSYGVEGTGVPCKPMARMVLFGGAAGGGKVMPF